MDKRFLGILAVLIIIFAGVFAISQHSSNKNSGGNSGQPTNHVQGQGKAGVTLTEYGDFQCPYCGGYEPVLQKVMQQFGDQIHFQFRNLPLTSLHPNAFAAARAAEAAGMQGKYWQMHDLLYQENQAYYDSGSTTWVPAKDPLNNFNDYAKQLGLNVTKFDQDYYSDQADNAINADVAAFDKTGAEQSTPAFFLDGKNLSDATLAVPTATNPYVYDQAKSLANFSKIINAEIAKKQKQ